MAGSLLEQKGLDTMLLAVSDGPPVFAGNALLVMAHRALFHATGGHMELTRRHGTIAARLGALLKCVAPDGLVRIRYARVDGALEEKDTLILGGTHAATERGCDRIIGRHAGPPSRFRMFRGMRVARTTFMPRQYNR
jgi:hypothetical protein